MLELSLPSAQPSQTRHDTEEGRDAVAEMLPVAREKEGETEGESEG